jgi:hypothetical protein
MIAELAGLKLPIVRHDENPRFGLAFDLLQRAGDGVHRLRVRATCAGLATAG